MGNTGPQPPKRHNGRRFRAAAVLGTVAAMVATLCGTAAPAGASLRAGTGESVNANKLPLATTAFRQAQWQWASNPSYNPYNPNVVPFDTYSLLGLAGYFDLPRPGKDPYYPELATSWKLGKSSIVVHLRRSAKWQNGQPLTSADVVSSMLVAGADFSSVWGYMTSVSAPNRYEVKIGLQPDAVARNVFVDLLQVTIVPKSQYGFVVPKGFESDLISYWKTYNVLHPTAATLKAAADSPAGKAMTAASTKLLKFAPKKLIGDGAYELTKATGSGIVYKKWNGWWDAKSITVPWVELIPMSASTMYGAMVSGRVDFQDMTQFTDPQVTRLESTGTGHYWFTPAPVQQESLVFNFKDYPFGILAVREALAYAINRPKLVQLDMGGTLVQDPPTGHPDGINDAEAKLYLSKEQINSLRPYKFNLKKAASLLRGAGFTEKNGEWITPKGKPFSFTITEEAGNSQFDEDGVIMAQQLKSFGIQASTTEANGATYTSQELQGDYAVSENFLDWGIGSPMADFAATFVNTSSAQGWNYPVYYNGKGACNCKDAINIGPESSVPGLGTVNVGAALNSEVNTAPPSTWSKYTYDWARWINQQLPILPLYNNAFHQSYTTSRYTNFPSRSQDWAWTVLAGAEQVVIFQQLGRLKLKQR